MQKLLVKVGEWGTKCNLLLLQEAAVLSHWFWVVMRKEWKKRGGGVTHQMSVVFSCLSLFLSPPTASSPPVLSPPLLSHRFPLFASVSCEDGDVCSCYSVFLGLCAGLLLTETWTEEWDRQTDRWKSAAGRGETREMTGEDAQAIRAFRERDWLDRRCRSEVTRLLLMRGLLLIAICSIQSV